VVKQPGLAGERQQGVIASAVQSVVARGGEQRVDLVVCKVGGQRAVEPFRRDRTTRAMAGACSEWCIAAKRSREWIPRGRAAAR